VPCCSRFTIPTKKIKKIKKKIPLSVQYAPRHGGTAGEAILSRTPSSLANAQPMARITQQNDQTALLPDPFIHTYTHTLTRTHTFTPCMPPSGNNRSPIVILLHKQQPGPQTTNRSAGAPGRLPAQRGATTRGPFTQPPPIRAYTHIIPSKHAHTHSDGAQWTNRTHPSTTTCSARMYACDRKSYLQLIRIYLQLIYIIQ